MSSLPADPPFQLKCAGPLGIQSLTCPGTGHIKESGPFRVLDRGLSRVDIGVSVSR